MNLKKLTLFFQKNINYIIIITLILIAFSATFGSSFLETLRLLKMKNDLSNQIIQGQEENSQLDEEIAQIGTQNHIEVIARKYLELYYPNEQIIIPVENSLQDKAKSKNSSDNNSGEESEDSLNYQETDTSEEVTDNNSEENQENIEESVPVETENIENSEAIE